MFPETPISPPKANRLTVIKRTSVRLNSANHFMEKLISLLFISDIHAKRKGRITSKPRESPRNHIRQASR